jgi:LPXTG-site transpeptidase (sortase) family protein
LRPVTARRSPRSSVLRIWSSVDAAVVRHFQPCPSDRGPPGRCSGTLCVAPAGEGAVGALVAAVPGGRRDVRLAVGTDLYSRYQQGNLHGQFGGTNYTDRYTTHTIPSGDVLTKLVICKKGIELTVLVAEGTTPVALRAGTGHYVGTPLPGEAGNVGIAGHRTTFGRPFNHLDELRPGDQLLLHTPLKIYRYVAVKPFAGHANPWVTTPKDISVIENLPGQHAFTLTTCNPMQHPAAPGAPD